MFKRELCYKHYDNLFYLHASDLEVLGNVNKGSRIHDAKIGSISKNLFYKDPMFPIIMRLEEDEDEVSHFYSAVSSEEFFMKEKLDNKYVKIEDMPFSKPFYRFNYEELDRLKENPLCFSVKKLNLATGGERSILKKTDYAEEYMEIIDEILRKASLRQERSFERNKNGKRKVLRRTKSI